MKDCDLIIEAIIERLDIKQALFERLEKLNDPDTIVASNTSGLRIVDMVQGRSDQFKKNFMITHFFNPPRYMKLLELVAGPETAPESKERVEAWGKRAARQGHRVGERHAELHREPHRPTVDDVDDPPHAREEARRPRTSTTITGIPMAHPKSATFRTADVVGLDTVGHVAANCYSAR